MEIQIRYQSRGGNTRAVAEIIGEMLNIKAEPLNIPLPEYTDLLFLGGGVYKWGADEELKKYFNTISGDKISKIAAFSTSGGMSVTIKQIFEAANRAGIICCNNSLCIKLLLQGHSALGRVGGNLTEEQINKAKAFVNAVIDEIGIV